MEKKELKALIKNLTRSYSDISDDELEYYHMFYTLHGKKYDVYLAGYKDMQDDDGDGDSYAFYQVGIDPKEDKAYKFFFEVTDEAFEQDDYSIIDYDNPYEVKEIPDDVSMEDLLLW